MLQQSLLFISYLMMTNHLTWCVTGAAVVHEDREDVRDIKDVYQELEAINGKLKVGHSDHKHLLNYILCI